MGSNKSITKLEPGKYYHIYNRGNNKETIFFEPDNYSHFLVLWKKYVLPVADTFCYNLLPNHFHFFIRVKDNGVADEHAISSFKLAEKIKTAEQQFANLFNAYAKAVNTRYNRTGSLFQERFRRKEIDNEAYYTSITGYIISNSVNHGFTKTSSAYPYSAYHALISDKPTLLARAELLDWFGGRERFIEYIGQYEHSITKNTMYLEHELDDD